MIKSEQVPQAAWIALRDLTHNGIRNEATLIAAALNAWPGASICPIPHWPGPYQEIVQVPSLILPLPQETRDDE